MSGQQITTAAELDALPVGSVFRLSTGAVMGRAHDREPAGLNFAGLGIGVGFTLAEMGNRFPATVLYRPDQQPTPQSTRDAVVHLLFDQAPDDWDENDIGLLADELIERAEVAFDTATPSSVAADRAVRTCRVCGCTDDRACYPGKGPFAVACHWVELDLCSACVGVE